MAAGPLFAWDPGCGPDGGEVEPIRIPALLCSLCGPGPTASLSVLVSRVKCGRATWVRGRGGAVPRTDPEART